MPSGADVAYPPRTSNLHHEIELVVAVGRGGRDIPVEITLTDRDTMKFRMLLGRTTLREGFEGEMNAHNIQVGVASQKDGKFKVLTPEQIQDYLGTSLTSISTTWWGWWSTIN